MINLNAMTPLEWWYVGSAVYIACMMIAYVRVRRINHKENSGNEYDWSCVLANVVAGLIGPLVCAVILIATLVKRLNRIKFRKPPSWL
jgi:glycerol uptake facilitator-like aquaporin